MYFRQLTWAYLTGSDKLQVKKNLDTVITAMGLAGNYKKEKISRDPRNTQWANDESRFGHTYLCQMGWKPGSGLGMGSHGITKHIQVKVKADNVGLGQGAKDDLPTGLDVFQRILGKLNGREREEEVNRQLADRQMMLGNRLNFVRSGVLEGTVDQFLQKTTQEVLEVAEIDSKSKSRSKSKSSSKKSKSDKTSKRDKSDKALDVLTDRKVKKDRKGSKKEAKNKAASETTAKKSQAASKAESDTDSLGQRESARSSPAPTGIRATRARYIKMKRAATADDKSLREIFMQT